ncbi:hypothetical protein PIB30_064802 [Stylosanthes scabra]|uniref:Uncharacterized protein n=1 Tax=Stylosanthes scabra TaxID=79078 RepID=A0ABU6ZKK8_9FABA|nr:hypothetical protein [Stylosanthes scabra]
MHKTAQWCPPVGQSCQVATEEADKLRFRVSKAKLIEANEVASQPMPLAPATKRTREKQPIRRKATRKSPPPSEPPSSSQHAGPSVETLVVASSGTKSRFKFMETPGLKQQ